METGFEGLVRLQKKDIPAAAEMMARAFEDYPLTAYSHPDPATRHGEMIRGDRSLLRFGIHYGEVYATSPAIEGAAMWFYSWNSQRTFWRNLRCGNFNKMFSMFRPGRAKFRNFIELAGAMQRRAAPKRHLYLQLLGVDPACQGQGLSSRLLRPMLARADREDLPCFLETQSEKNVSIYRHFGFEVMEEQAVPGSDVRTWAMLRRPGGK